MAKLLTLLVFFVQGWSSSAHSNAQYMRRQDATKENSEQPEERLLVAGIASSGAVLTHDAKQSEHDAQAAASLAAFRSSFSELQTLRDEIGKSDVYDKDGFQVLEVTKEQLVKEVAAAHQLEVAESAKISEKDMEKEAIGGRVKQYETPSLLSKEQHKKFDSESYLGNDAVVSGFWAEDRPHEERIDPDNMKIYTYKTYKSKFPYQHSWLTETEWKKLPLAPKKVHKVRKHRAKASEAGAFMEEGTTLVDENQQELVWTKDGNGYYHRGLDTPSELEVAVAASPNAVSFNALLDQNEKEEADRNRGMYKEYGSKIAELRQKLKGEPFVRLKAQQEVAQVLAEMEDTVGSKRSSTGKAFVSVEGAEGTVCSFSADIAKVTALAVKHRIEQITGIPWEGQMLFVKGVEVKDPSLLSEYVGGGRNMWIDLQQRDYQTIEAARKKRAKKPIAKNQIKAASLLEQKAVSLPSSMEEQEGAERASGEDMNDEDTASKEEDDEDDKQETGHEETFDMDTYDGVASRRALLKGKDKKVDEATLAKMAENLKKAKDDIVKSEERKEQFAMRASDTKPASEGPPATVVDHTGTSSVTRQVIYVRDGNGKWNVEKEEVATPDHPIDLSKEFDVIKDEGVPVQERLSSSDDSEDSKPISFIQTASSSSGVPEKAGAAKKDEALREATASKKEFVIRDASSMKIDLAKSARLEATRKWKEAANPVEPYEGAADDSMLSELSKARTKKEKAYDGMQAVQSGFWAGDRPNERRVDISDHKVYTWRQFRAKYPFKHSMYVERMWKNLPTEKRVKKLGMKAFVQRFR